MVILGCVNPNSMTGVLIRRNPENLPLPLKGRPQYEDKRQSLKRCYHKPRNTKVAGNHHKLGRSMEQILLQKLQQKSTLPAPCSLTSGFQNSETINFCCTNLPVSQFVVLCYCHLLLPSRRLWTLLCPY